MLQKITPQESNLEQLESIKAELEEKTSSLKIYQQTQLEYVRFKEECEKSDLVKKKLEAKLRKVEESAEKNLTCFKQMKMEKKVLEKELKQMQKKLDDFQSSKRKKGMKNTQTQTGEAFVNVDKRKIKLLLEELWECIDSTTDNSNNELHLLDDRLLKSPDLKARDRKNGKRGRNLKSIDECTMPPSHSSPFVVSQMQKTPTQLPFSQALHEHKNSEEGAADCNGDSAFYEDKTTDFFVPRDFIHSYSTVSDVERDSEFLQILDWAKPLPPLLSPIRFSPTQDLFGEMTDLSAREEGDCTEPFSPICSMEYVKSDESPDCGKDQTDHESRTNLPVALQERTETPKDLNDIGDPKETDTDNPAECAVLCMESSNQVAPAAETQDEGHDLLTDAIQVPTPPELKEAVCENSTHSQIEGGKCHEEPSQSMCTGSFSENISTNDLDVPLSSEDAQTAQAIPECNNNASVLREEYQETSSASVPKVERDMSRHTFDPIQRPKEFASELEIQEETSELGLQSKDNVQPNKDNLDFPCSSSANSHILFVDKCANAVLPSTVNRNVDCLEHSSIAECEVLFDRLNLMSSSCDLVSDSTQDGSSHACAPTLPVQSENDSASDDANTKSNEKGTEQIPCTEDLLSSAKCYSDNKGHALTADGLPSVFVKRFSKDAQEDEHASSSSVLTVSAPLVNEEDEEPMQWELTESKEEHPEPELEEKHETMAMKDNQGLNCETSDKITSSCTKEDCTKECDMANYVKNDQLLSLDRLENKVLQHVNTEDQIDVENKPVSTSIHSQDTILVSGKTILKDSNSLTSCDTVSPEEFVAEQPVTDFNNSDSAPFYNKLSEDSHNTEIPINSRIEPNVVTAELDSTAQENIDNSKSKDSDSLTSCETVSPEEFVAEQPVTDFNNSDSAPFYNKLSEDSHNTEIPINSRIEPNVVTAELDSTAQENIDNSKSKDSDSLTSCETVSPEEFVTEQPVTEQTVTEQPVTEQTLTDFNSDSAPFYNKLSEDSHNIEIPINSRIEPNVVTAELDSTAQENVDNSKSKDSDSRTSCETVSPEEFVKEQTVTEQPVTEQTLTDFKSDSAPFYNKLSEDSHIEIPINSRIEPNVVTAELDSTAQENVDNSKSKDNISLNSISTSNKLEILPSAKEIITPDLLQTDIDASTKSNRSGELHDEQSRTVLPNSNEFADQTSALLPSTEEISDRSTEQMLKDNINSLEHNPSSPKFTTTDSESVTDTDEKDDSTNVDLSDTVVCHKQVSIEVDVKLLPEEKNLNVPSDTEKPVVCGEDSIACPLKESQQNAVTDMKIHEELCIEPGAAESSDESEDDTPIRKVNYKSINQNNLFSTRTNLKSIDSDDQVKSHSVTEGPSKTVEIANLPHSLKNDLNVVRAEEDACVQAETVQKEKFCNIFSIANIDADCLKENVAERDSKPVTSPVVPVRAEINNPLSDQKYADPVSITAQPEKDLLSCDKGNERRFIKEPSDGDDPALPGQVESLNNNIAEQTASSSFVEANCIRTAPGKNLIWNLNRSDRSERRAISGKSIRCKVPSERKTVLLGDKSLASNSSTDSDQREHNRSTGVVSPVHNIPAVRKDCPSQRVTRSRNQSQNASVGQTVLANADTSTSTEHSPETLNKVRSEMGPPLPPLLGPLLATPPRSLRPISPIMSSSSRSSLPSPLDDLISPLRETPVPPLMSPLSDSRRRKSPMFNTPSPSEKTNRRILSSPLQFCAATPKHALPVPGRLPPSATGNSGATVQENSVKILDTMYPELSARARTLNILKGNVQLNRCLPGDCRNVPVSQISGFKAITSTSTAFIKTGSSTKGSTNKDKQKDCESLQLSSNKRTIDSVPMPKSAKRLRLDSESPVTENLKDCFTVPASKGQLEEKRRPSCDLSGPDPIKGKVKAGQPDEDAVTSALKKIEELCFDLLPVIRSHIHVGTVPCVPVMRNEEKEVVYEFSHTKKDLSGHFLNTILKTMKAGKTSLDGKYLQALCRVYVGLCRQLGDLERARVLCYNIIKEGFPEPEKLLLFAVSTWSEMFSFHGVICKAMQALLKYLAKEDVLACLRAYLKWEKSPAMNINTMLPSILMAIQMYPDVKFQTSEQYGEDLPDHIWEYVFAVDVLCCHYKWTWTHDNVISKELWPILDKWIKHKKGNVNVQFVPDITVATVLRLLGRLCQMGLKEGSVTAVKNIASAIIAFIMHANQEGMPWGIQLASVYMLRDLCPCDPAAVHKTLCAWKESATNTIPPAVTSCISQVASLCNPEK
ncbi:little elongation complex subunit 1 [Spea bombifrons]|uniref:little elongation complex subunit 1 n=1 Tax=Spea bombifrons TaxID=233779 RepID=UPI00234AB0CC|nr:little elongation complex subunit 1 [Spea bombifrons]